VGCTLYSVAIMIGEKVAAVPAKELGIDETKLQG
jgi:hypothetical protein